MKWLFLVITYLYIFIGTKFKPRKDRNVSLPVFIADFLFPFWAENRFV